MHPVELQNVLDSMTIIVDSREQQTEQAEKRYAAFGCDWKREKLDFGDYSAEFVMPDSTIYSLGRVVVVERKMSLDELCGCYTRERERFAREFKRAADNNARVYLLIENATWEQVYNGKYRSQMTPSALSASIFAWLARYDCRVLMCKAETSGRLIRDVLYREAKERLTMLAQ